MIHLFLWIDPIGYQTRVTAVENYSKADELRNLLSQRGTRYVCVPLPNDAVDEAIEELERIKNVYHRQEEATGDA